MAVKIRLARIGKKKTPFYRLIAIDSRRKRNGIFLENLGTFDGLQNKIVTFHENSYHNWITKGAIPTDSAKKIYNLYKKSKPQLAKSVS